MLKKAVVIFLMLAISITSFAEEEKSGFFGNLELGAGYSSFNPAGDDVTDDTKKIKSLTNGDDESEFFGYVSGSIGYDFVNTGTTLFVGAEKEGLLLGVDQELGDFGLLGVEYTFSSREVWKNPYVLKRSKTDEITHSLSVEFSEIMDTGAIVGLEFGSIDVDSDKVTNKDLERDGKFSALNLGYAFYFSEDHHFIPLLSFRNYDFDGESNSHGTLSFGGEHSISFSKFTFDTSIMLTGSGYDKKHPVFNKKREDAEFDIMETISYAAPFGYEQTYLFLTLGYSKRESNIDFYDSDGFVTATGIGFNF